MQVGGREGGREEEHCSVSYHIAPITPSLAPLLLYSFTPLLTHTHTHTLILTPLQRAKQLNSSQVTKFGFLINLRWNPILLAHPQQVLLPREPAKPNQKRERESVCVCVCVCVCVGVWVSGSVGVYVRKRGTGNAPKQQSVHAKKKGEGRVCTQRKGRKAKTRVGEQE